MELVDVSYISASVLMITYNHEKYISQAIEGVLMQKTNFPVQLVIGEDCSTDNTRSICEEYAAKYPEQIVLLPKGPNLGINKNYIRTLQNCKGKYVAYCEGDDFWTDPEKLQQQVDFLENNPEYACVYHDDTILKERDANYEIYKPRIQDATTRDIIANHFIPSLSIVFRNIFTDEHYKIMIIAGCLDLSTEFFVSLYGKFYYIDKKMATYRLHGGGVTASYKGFINRTLSNIRFYKHFNTFTQNIFLDTLFEKSKGELKIVQNVWPKVNSIRVRIYRKLWISRFILYNFPGNFSVRMQLSLNSLFKK